MCNELNFRRDNEERCNHSVTQLFVFFLFRFAKSGKRLLLLQEIKFSKTQSKEILICLTSRYLMSLQYEQIMCSSRKYPYSPLRRDWNFLVMVVSVRPKKLKKCMELNWNFQRGENLRKKPFHWGRYGYFLDLHVHSDCPLR